MEDGGPAFPHFVPEGHYNGSVHYEGMTLRDYFAGQAIMGFMASTKRPTTIAPDDATWAYTIADAMIAARDAK